MIKRAIAAILIFSVCVTHAGCSMVVPGKQRFSVTASEPDAKIYVNGDYLGKGAVKTRVPRNHDVSILVKKENYLPVCKNIGTDFSMTGILDIIGGCLIIIPWMGLFFPGARQLEESNVAIVLEKEGAD
jgi:hypothetical protein